MDGFGMDVKRQSRVIGKMTAIALFARKNNVTFIPLDDPNITLSHIIGLIMQRNMYIETPLKYVDILFPSAYKLRPSHGLLTDEQIDCINKIDNRILITETG